jgi:biopolymer transport protein TolQ
MKVNVLFLTSNPFIDAFQLSDLLGKLIFIGLILLSICTWVVLIYKSLELFRTKKNSLLFQKNFRQQQATPLNVNCDLPKSQKSPNSFLNLYVVLRKQSMEMLHKNHHFSETQHMSPTDIDVVEAHLFASIASETKKLESQLYLLSTIVSLAPFLGLLGTVWGILTTFSELHNHTGGSIHEMVLGGLSLALATTVLGLIDAIPALIGYNYLKNTIGSFQVDMEGFAMEILTSVEMQYRQVDVRQHKTQTSTPSKLQLESVT